MLDVKISKKEQKIRVEGNVIEIYTDVGVLIKAIYEGLDNEDVKKIFAENMTEFMTEKIYAKSSEELAELTKERVKKAKKEKEEEREKAKEELMEVLKELLGIFENKDRKI